MPDNGRMPFDWKRIKPRRVKLDKTMPQCAADAGLPNRQKWYQYETGKVPDPQLSTLEGIARALDWDVNDLLAPPPRRAGKRKR
jgi:transcriptional regulator with XRE-family HTH domain